MVPGGFCGVCVIFRVECGAFGASPLALLGCLTPSTANDVATTKGGNPLRVYY